MKQVKDDIDTSKYTTLRDKWQKDYNDFQDYFKEWRSDLL